MRVLVTGASGFVGGHLVSALLERGHDVRALVRNEATYDEPLGVDVVEGDLLDAASIEHAFDDVDAAYYLVHSMEAGDAFEARDRRAAQNFADAASATGVGRVIYLGGLGADEDALSEHLQSRREVEHILAGGDYQLTTLRAAIIVGAGSVSFRTIYQLAKRLPVMLTPQWVRTKCQPIAIRDVVTYLVGVLETPDTAGETYEIGGPDVVTYQAMLQTTAALMGRRLFVVPIPVLSPKLSSYWVDLVTDVPAAVAHPLIEGLRNPVVVTDHEIERHIAIDGIPFREAAARALREYGEPVPDDATQHATRGRGGGGSGGGDGVDR